MLLFIVFPLEQLFSPVLFLEAGGFAIFFFTCTPRAVKKALASSSVVEYMSVAALLWKEYR